MIEQQGRRGLLAHNEGRGKESLGTPNNGCVRSAIRAFATSFFVSSATPFFRSFATRTFATPKNLFLILEGVVDKELAKLVEKVNEELVMDVVVEGVVDNR